jgi:hypothetical protein
LHRWQQSPFLQLLAILWRNEQEGEPYWIVIKRHIKGLTSGTRFWHRRDA